MRLNSLNSGLIGHWLLDGTHKARDLSGYENHGTPQGGITIGGATDRHGQAGGATSSTDASKYVSLPDITLSKTQGYTISLWYKPTVSDLNMVMGCVDVGHQSRIGPYVSSNQIYAFAENANQFIGNYTFTLNVWMHICYTVSGSTSYLYANANSLSAVGGYTTSDFKLNRLLNAHVSYLCNGSLSDVRIYNRALSQTEITQLYDSYKPRTVLQSINESGLLLHLDAGNKSSYPGTGATWKDLSGNGYNATLVHSPTYSAANGGILSFDGSNDYAYTTATPFTANSDYTIQIWQKNTESTNRIGILFTNKEYWNSGEGVHILNITSPLIFYSMTRTNSGSQEAGFGITLPATSWTLITVKRASNLYYTYRDTTVVRNGASITGTITDQYNYFSIAGRGSGGVPTYAWPGKIGQILVYQRALSAAEILQNYNATKGRFGL